MDHPTDRTAFALRKLLVPAIILAISAGVYLVLVGTKPQLGTTPKEPVPVAVRAMTVNPTTISLSVTSEGNVQPKIETKLVSQVAGEVVSISPSLASGGEFKQGDVLLRLDPRDYEIALARAQANRKRMQAEKRYADEEAARIRSLYADELASVAELQNIERLQSVAQAAADDAAAAVDRAKIDLARTVFVAPYNGRVRDEAVDLGQFIPKGATIATLYDIDRLEVRLPLADAQLAYLNPSFAQTGLADDTPANVTLTANYAGSTQTWEAKLLRTEGDIAKKSRFLHLIVEVSQTVNDNGVRLPVGLFVDAKIEGRSVDNLVSVPRTALRPDNAVMVIDEASRLHFRPVSIFKLSDQTALISDGLATGERISISPLQFVVEGMPVTVIE